jgi:hypothetical protein
MPRPQPNETYAKLFQLHGNHKAISAGKSGLDQAAKAK